MALAATLIVLIGACVILDLVHDLHRRNEED